MLQLWEEPATDHRNRVVADSADRIGWLRARRAGITATDAARLCSTRSLHAVAWQKQHGTGFTGNAYTEHGVAREPELAAWVLANHAIPPNTALFHARQDRLHLATPDGVTIRSNGAVELAEIKTTTKSWRSIPRPYLRQVWWQQHVLGAERTLLVWEQHDNFVPVGAEPESRWIDRDEKEIDALIRLAGELLTLLRPRPA